MTSLNLSASISVAAKAKPSLKPLGTTLFLFCAYLCTAVACLWQWGTAQPWSRVDIFSGSLLLLLAIWSWGTVHYHRAIFFSPEVMREASGEVFDPLMFFWIDVFALGWLTVFFDYGHWHLVPQLQQPVLQTIGLLVCIGCASWIIWTDAYLSRQFHDLTGRKVLTEGPYYFVRHPRYAALIVSAVAVSLALASILGWFLTVGWIWVNIKRVQLEEVHLRNLFGAEYDNYAARTPRFFPGIY